MFPPLLKVSKINLVYLASLNQNNEQLTFEHDAWNEARTCIKWRRTVALY